MAASDFPSMSQPEYTLMLSVIKETARLTAEETVSAYAQAHCLRHQERTSILETIVLGHPERGMVGLNTRMAEVEERLGDSEEVAKDRANDRKLMRRTIVIAIISGVISLTVALIMFSITLNVQ
jgi:hypothetical protein